MRTHGCTRFNRFSVSRPHWRFVWLAYGTAIRVGYEIVFPALFGNKTLPKDAKQVMGDMRILFTSIGGLEANAFGINQGIKKALKDMDADPELVELIKKNSEYDSQNITVSLSGSSQALLEQGFRSLRGSRGGGLQGEKDAPPIIAQDIQDEVDRKRFERGDVVCSRAFGVGSKVSQDFKYCILASGAIRDYPVVKELPIPEREIITTDVLLEKERQVRERAKKGISALLRSISIFKKRIALAKRLKQTTRPSNVTKHREHDRTIIKNQRLIVEANKSMALLRAKL